MLNLDWLLAYINPLLATLALWTSPDSVTPSSFAASQYDIVIVGGGTAGLVVANRLSAATAHSSKPLRVGVIEAGGFTPSGDPLVDIPFGANIYTSTPEASTVGNPKYDWMFQSVPQAALDGHVIGYPRGKILGGSSVLHAMAWQRGAKFDYDAWGSPFGNGDEWTFDGLLPYFQRAENWTAPPNAVTINSSLSSAYGRNGPLSLSYSSYYTDLDRSLTEASVNMGFPLNESPDMGNSNYLPRYGIAGSVNPNTGKRSYSASAYYNEDVRSRENLKLLTGAVVTRILWDETTLGTSEIRAKGVEYIAGGKTYVVHAMEEVILCAGSLKTPQLLELSGVGNASLLNALGIPVVLDLPEIGENLMDHPVSISDFKVKDGIETLDWLNFNETHFKKHHQLYTDSGAGAFTFTPRITGGWPLKDIISSAEYRRLRKELDLSLSQTNLTPLQHAQYEALRKMLDRGDVAWFMPAVVPRGGMISAPQSNTGYITIIGFQLHEFSRGSVHINSTDPMDAPLIDNKFLFLPWDLNVQINGMKFIRKWVQTEPVASRIEELVSPPESTESDAEWEQWIKKTIWSMAHPMGSTAMASRSLGGIVNPRLKVYGLANVRIIDAGIIPMTVGSPIQSVVYALAEKGTDMLIEDIAVGNHDRLLRSQEL